MKADVYVALLHVPAAYKFGIIHGGVVVHWLCAGYEPTNSPKKVAEI